MTPTNLEKLRAGIVKIPCSCGKPGCVLQLREETESLMRQAADEIEELRRQVAGLQASVDAAHRLIAPLGNSVTPSVLAIREALRILRGAL